MAGVESSDESQIILEQIASQTPDATRRNPKLENARGSLKNAFDDPIVMKAHDSMVAPLNTHSRTSK